jgi:hypothetical protein
VEAGRPLTRRTPGFPDLEVVGGVGFQARHGGKSGLAKACHLYPIIKNPLMTNRSTTWKFKDAEFNGISGKLVIPENPLVGATAFSIEVRFRPQAGGEVEQRFLHIQGDDGSRALLELRSTEAGWYGDVFVHFESGGKFLNDPALLHPFGGWMTMALVYDGKLLRQYVNGELELEGGAPGGILGAGKTSIGMRLNDISPFKGRIAAVRFTPEALTSQFLLL